ncbi:MULTISPECIES: hypothetical protein [unclassified Myroides]|uniref:hypothetical protein n=1 Tax=unclassified Myroides TaxID=2642485 RepID=UPI0015FE6E2D|nr:MULTISPECIES: hypothetical protein [unclassified Myroides]MBB1149422.1 hypothetical protein [Myroides sp. NP-2]MDM1406674.1 hypothetical protein [Myroides sp. DF42-4-2]
MKQITTYIIVLFTALVGLSTTAWAQVTIGSEGIANRAALLDIKDRITPGINNETATTGGLLLPRVLLVNSTTLEPFIATTDAEWVNNASSKIKEKHIGLQVYNLSTTNGFTKGMYIWNGVEWEKQDLPTEDIVQNINYFFYLPSFNISIQANQRKEVDLYAEYERQFTRSLNANFISNPGYTLDVLPIAGTDRLYQRNELDYVITDFDESIINPNTISISNDGKLTFDVSSTHTSSKSYFNILFIVKR